MAAKIAFTDKSSPASKREVDVNGYVNISDNPLTRIGVFPYTKAEIQYPGWENDPDAMIGVLRHPDDVASQAALESLKRKPIIINHTMAEGGEGARVDGKPLEQIGPQGTTGDDIVYDPATGVVSGSISLWTATGQAAVDKFAIGEFSLGYNADLVFENGAFNGQPYAAKQKNIIYNHVALVPAGRMGSDIRVLDHAPGGRNMKTLKWKKLGKKLGFGDAATRSQVLSSVLGVAESALPTMDAKTLAHFDAEVDAKDEGEGGGNSEMTVAELTAAIKAMQPLMAQMQTMMAGEKKEAANIEAGEGLAGIDSPMAEAMKDAEKEEGKEMLKDGMEPAGMMDGMPLRGFDGRIIYKPAGMSFADAKSAKKLRTGKPPSQRMAGQDAKPAGLTAAQVEQVAAAKAQAILDAANSKATDTQAAMALAARASARIGTFDAAGKTLHQVAAYVLGKLEPGNTASGSEALGYVNALLNAKATPSNANAAISWGDSADAGGKFNPLAEAGAM